MRIKFNKSLYNVQPQEKIQIQLTSAIDQHYKKILAVKSCKDKLQASNFSASLEVPTEGNIWSDYVTEQLESPIQKRIWYFSLQDCQQLLKDKIPNGLRIIVEIEIIQQDGSHFSAEESGLLTPYFIIFILCTLFQMLNIQKIKKLWHREEDFDWPFFLTNLALFLQILNILFEWIHLFFYSYDGKGIFILQLFDQIFGILAQYIIAIVFILISWGWTINYIEPDSFDIYIPLAVLLGIVHMMIVGLNKLTDDESDKNHQYDGVVGTIIAIIRISMFIYFLFGLYQTHQNAREKVKAFIYKFGIFGSLFFLSFPIVLGISKFQEDYNQNKFIILCTLLMQSFAFVSMSKMFSSKQGEYFAISLKAQTILPDFKYE